MRENRDGTIVLTDGEWNRSRFLHNGNYLLWGMELKLLKQLSNGAKFEKVAEYNEEELRIIYKYEKALKDQDFKMRMRLKGLEAEEFGAEDGKGMLHRLFKEQSIPLKNVNKLRKLGTVVSGNGTVDYEIELAGRDGLVEVYNYSLVGTYDKQALEEVGEGYFVLNDVEERQFGGARTSSIKNYYKGSGGFDYSMEYEKPLNSLEFFYEMVYGRAGEMFLKPPYSKYLEAEGGEQYDYYTIERDYDEGYMNAREPTLKTNRLFDPLYYTQYMMMNDMSDRISTAFHPNAEVREQSGYGTREKQRDAIFNGLKSWNEQMIEDLNGVKRSIDRELGDRKFEAETFEAKGYRNPYAFRKPKLVDTDKYDGHTKGSWDRLSEYCPVGKIDRSLIADAPMLLEEVKDGNRIKEYIYQFAQYPSVKNINLADLIAFIEEDDERYEAEEFEAEESINPKDYIAITFLDQQGNGHPSTLLNTYDLRFGERGSTYFKALREALDEGVKRGDYEGYKIKKRTSKPLQDKDYVYERRYNDEYEYEVRLMGDKFFYGDSDIPVVKNKYAINDGEPKFADMVYLNVIPKEKTEPMDDNLGSLFGVEDFALEDGQRIPNLTNDEWKAVSKALGEVGTFHDWEHGGTDGEGGGGTTLIVNKENGVFGKKDEYECRSCGYMYHPSLFEGFDKHTPLSWCEYCRDEEEEELEAKYGAETFEAKGIDTFTEPFDELRTGSILNKAILLGSLGVGAMIGLKLRK